MDAAFELHLRGVNQGTVNRMKDILKDAIAGGIAAMDYETETFAPTEAQLATLSGVASGTGLVRVAVVE